MTLLSERSAEDYKRTVNSVLDDIKNLNYLSNRLLLLAQASSESVESSFGSIRVDELLWQSAGELQKRNPSYKVSISFNEDLEDDQMTIVGNEQLIKTALLNLMDNGCKYSDPHEVQVSVEPGRGRLVLTFRHWTAAGAKNSQTARGHADTYLKKGQGQHFYPNASGREKKLMPF